MDFGLILVNRIIVSFIIQSDPISFFDLSYLTSKNIQFKDAFLSMNLYLFISMCR